MPSSIASYSCSERLEAAYKDRSTSQEAQRRCTGSSSFITPANLHT